MSLNLIVGYSGKLSIAHAAYMGIGAYTAALISIHFGINIIWGIVMGAIVAGIIAFLFEYFSMNIKGDEYILTSFVFQMVVFEVLMQWTSLTRGSYGLNAIPRPSIFGIVLNDLFSFFILAFVITFAIAIFLDYLANSYFGIELRGLRDGERAMKSLGKNTNRLKLITFTIGGVMAGIAGGLHASMIRFIYPGDFSVMMSISILIYIIVGGMGNIRGTILGVFILMIIPQAISFIPFIPSAMLGPIQQVIYGLVLMGFVWFRPQGIFPEKPIIKLKSYKNKGGIRVEG